MLGIRDITDFKRREEELQAAREAAGQASRIKSQFLSTMSHELRTPPEEWIEFRVTDRGPGIPPDQLESIFQPFVQVGSTGLVTADGTGLGLTISRELARLRGGDVTAGSVAGEGNTFTFRQPRNTDGGPASQREQKKGGTVN